MAKKSTSVLNTEAHGNPARMGMLQKTKGVQLAINLLCGFCGFIDVMRVGRMFGLVWLDLNFVKPSPKIPLRFGIDVYG
jgi:hypothetical protein